MRAPELPTNVVALPAKRREAEPAQKDDASRGPALVLELAAYRHPSDEDPIPDLAA
jgi:hypothetical protein